MHVLGEHNGTKTELCPTNAKSQGLVPTHFALIIASEAFLANTTIIKVFLRCGEPVGAYILGPTCAWWQKTTNRQTDTHTLETTTVTLVVHARHVRGNDNKTPLSIVCDIINPRRACAGGLR